MLRWLLSILPPPIPLLLTPRWTIVREPVLEKLFVLTNSFFLPLLNGCGMNYCSLCIVFKCLTDESLFFGDDFFTFLTF